MNFHGLSLRCKNKEYLNRFFLKKQDQFWEIRSEKSQTQNDEQKNINIEMPITIRDKNDE